MQTLVVDASVLIELARRSLLPAIFHLPCTFAVPDIMYEDELLHLHGTDKQDLKKFGLLVLSVDAEELALAMEYRGRCPSLSLPDCFALTLARQNQWPLVSSDKRMRKAALQDSIRVRGIFWLIDQLHDKAVAPRAVLLQALQQMHDDPRTHLPKDTITKRINSLRNA